VHVHVYTRAYLTDIFARKIARVGLVGGQVGEDRHACPARGKLNGEVAGHADFRAYRVRPTSARARHASRAEVGEDVRVGVGPMEFQLNGSF